MLAQYNMMVIYSSESIFWSAVSNALILSVLYFLPYQQETWGKYISERAFRAFVLLYGFFLGIHYIRKWINQPKNLLLDSCRKGCLKGVKEALSSGSCVNQSDESEGGMTPLMLAVGAKNIQIVDYLLKRSAIDVKRKDKDGWTALHMACVLGNSSAVLRLAKHYATIGETMEEESDVAKITPLMWCVRLGHMECFKELIAFPWVNLETKDIYDQTLEDVARWSHFAMFSKSIFFPAGRRRILRSSDFWPRSKGGNEVKYFMHREGSKVRSSGSRTDLQRRRSLTEA